MSKVPGWAFYIIVVSCIIVLLWLYPEIDYEVHRTQVDLPIDEYWVYFWSRNALLGLLIYEVISFLWRGFSFLWRGSSHRIVMAAAHLFCAGLIVLVFHFVIPLHTGLQFVRAALFSDRYRACAEQAPEYAPGKKFAICDNRNRGELFEVIVFDSEGEVAKHQSQRTTEFRNYPRQPYVVAYCNLGVTELRAHLYLAASSC